MSGPDEKKINHLYKLMREKKQSDPDVAASLRWAIFSLEDQARQWQQLMDELYQVMYCATKLSPEINSIIDTRIFHEIVKGYIVVAMNGAMIERKEILDAVNALEDAFEDTDAEAARKAYRELQEGPRTEDIIAPYKRTEDAEDAEDAWTSYKLSLCKPERDALRADGPKYNALLGLFFSAGDPEKLKQYASMTVDELAQLAAGTDAAVLAKMDAATFDRTVADLETSDPVRLAAALASLQKMRQEP